LCYMLLLWRTGSLLAGFPFLCFKSGANESLPESFAD
jgi:hypothetical protein